MTLREEIERAFEGNDVPEIRERIQEVLSGIECGQLRVAEKTAEGWHTNDWIKKALILVFKYFPVEVYSDGVSSYFDRVPPRFRDSGAT